MKSYNIGDIITIGNRTFKVYLPEHGFYCYGCIFNHTMQQGGIECARSKELEEKLGACAWSKREDKNNICFERLDNNSIGNIEEEQLLYLLKHYFHCLYVSFKDKVCIYNKKEYLNYDEIIQVLKDNKEKFYNEGKFITIE